MGAEIVRKRVEEGAVAKVGREEAHCMQACREEVDGRTLVVGLRGSREVGQSRLGSLQALQKTKESQQTAEARSQGSQAGARYRAATTDRSSRPCEPRAGP